MLESAVSCVTHGEAGEICIDLPLDGPTATDPRLDGGSKLKLTFSAPLGLTEEEACAAIFIKSCGGLHIEPDRLACEIDDSETMLTVTFPGLTTPPPQPPQLPNLDCYVFDLTDLGVAGDADFVIRIHEGDFNDDHELDPLDVGAVLARFGCEVTADDPNCYLADINNDGEVDPLDSGFVLARLLYPPVCPCD